MFIKMHDHLWAGLREALGKNVGASVGIADSQGEIKGRKRHLLVDLLGLMIAAAVGAANCTDLDADP